MGELFMADGWGRAVTWGTISCPHCQAIIVCKYERVGGISKRYAETPYRCQHCGGRPICKFCGEVRKGECRPIQAVVEHAVKTGVWQEDLTYTYKSVFLPDRDAAGPVSTPTPAPQEAPQ